MMFILNKKTYQYVKARALTKAIFACTQTTHVYEAENIFINACYNLGLLLGTEKMLPN